MSMAKTDKCPPQFVFEIILAQATRAFLAGDEGAEEICGRIAESFDETYDTDALYVDLIEGVERLLIFIESVEISDVDLFLYSFMWFSCNFESVSVKRKKKPLFGGLLKGRPKAIARVYTAALSFKTYTYAVGSGKVTVRPDEWKPEDEEEFAPVFQALFPVVDPSSDALA